MLVFDLLRTLEPRLDPTSCKVHLASHNGFENPLQVYLAGKFDDWQAWQTKRNFERQFVVALIQLAERNRWLYVGAYEQQGSVPHPDKTKEGVVYRLKPLPAAHEFAGRLTGDFARPGRQPYLNGESVASSFHLHEIKSEKLHLDDFPGFKKVNLSFGELGLIAQQRIASWRAALENAAGVYLISDGLTGKLYVGSATGEGGIWSRWCSYLNGHGDNVLLRRLVRGDPKRAEYFRFSVLEIADTHTGQAEILTREAHWKEVLLSRLHGHNAN